MGDELPYRLNVVIEKIDDSKKLKTIYAAVITESQSQKGIILGKQGSMIKAIGTAARKELEKEFSKKVNLQLWVKANKNWTNDINKLKNLGLELILKSLGANETEAILLLSRKFSETSLICELFTEKMAEFLS